MYFVRQRTKKQDRARRQLGTYDPTNVLANPAFICGVCCLCKTTPQGFKALYLLLYAILAPSMDIKALFLKTYANVPSGSRTEIIAVVKGEPYTWQSAKLEVEQDTAVGKEILQLLVNLKILNG